MNQLAFNRLVRRIGSASSIDVLHLTDGVDECSHVFNPNGAAVHELRSLSKLVVSLCVGILIASRRFAVDGDRLSVNTRIWPVLSEAVAVTNASNVAFLEAVTIKHLLTQTTGYTSETLLTSATLGGKNEERLLEWVLNEPLVHAPGSRFAYSNASAFILSAFLQVLTGQTVYNLARTMLFGPLSIENHFWKQLGPYSTGATGLSLAAPDVHKLGELLLNEGAWAGLQIVPLNYIREMITPHVNLAPRWRRQALAPTGYGYFVWINRCGYYINGARGQYIIVRPNRRRVITILSNEENPARLLNCIKGFL